MLQYLSGTEVLVLSAHADDIELGCGATVSKLVQQGAVVHSVVFSLRSTACPPNYSLDQLAEETRNAHLQLGITEDRVRILDFENRHFLASRQKILDTLVEFEKRLKPVLVLAPSCNDIHQDHTTLASESLRAFKHTSVLGYEMLWNNMRQSYDLFVEIDQNHLERKIAAIQCYQSQLQLRSEYFSPDYLRSLAFVRGTQIKKNFAECFEVKRIIV